MKAALGTEFHAGNIKFHLWDLEKGSEGLISEVLLLIGVSEEHNVKISSW
jgi:hypothetical protein